MKRIECVTCKRTHQYWDTRARCNRGFRKRLQQGERPTTPKVEDPEPERTEVTCTTTVHCSAVSSATWLGLAAILATVAICSLWSWQRAFLVGTAGVLLLLAVGCACMAYKTARQPKSPTIAPNT
jgi:hypothetical protein